MSLWLVYRSVKIYFFGSRTELVTQSDIHQHIFYHNTQHVCSAPSALKTLQRHPSWDRIRTNVRKWCLRSPKAAKAPSFAGCRCRCHRNGARIIWWCCGGIKWYASWVTSVLFQSKNVSLHVRKWYLRPHFSRGYPIGKSTEGGHTEKAGSNFKDGKFAGICARERIWKTIWPWNCTIEKKKKCHEKKYWPGHG